MTTRSNAFSFAKVRLPETRSTATNATYDATPIASTLMICDMLSNHTERTCPPHRAAR